ncbi:HupE/UreJ family protein [Pararhizobium sp. BT-229]|uniref:HupE/UreJ family protein n=1 Tax=Pararhizobium sp. BT-229 TaxID=2986923 RepID=UPI0021F79406|nr:HupE/UreJ family protein [Pararhizobium sp. BT-229]MCV9966879.1 HupE/UreJ family protein [Pararhizobium sp. BT-229]
MIRFLNLVAGCFLLLVSAACPHELRPAFLEINEIVPARYAITWKVPARGDARMALYVRLPETCRQEVEPVGGFIETAYVSRWQMECVGGLAGQVISIDGLSSTYTDALAKIVNLDGTTQTSRISPDFPDLTVAATPTAFGTARTYFFLGVQHIMLGIDHLLFVFALLLLIRKPKALLLTITSFTVAHSITLAFAALGIASAPQPPVEALVALSIMFVASEIIRANRGSIDLSSRYPWLISFLFGLLHGFGFGGALREIGLPQKDVPLALLTFNLGVEAGQLIFVAVALVAMASFRLLFPFDVSRLRFWLAYLIGTLSAFWLVQRVAGFG